MKRFNIYLPLVVSFTIILLIGLIGLPAIANTTTQEQQQWATEKWPGYFDCGTTDGIVNFIQNNKKEEPILESTGVLQIPPAEVGGEIRMVKSAMVLYFNPKTQTWSMVAHFQNAYSCVLTFGIDMSGDLLKEQYKQQILEGLKKYQGDQDSKKTDNPEIKTIQEDNADSLA